MRDALGFKPHVGLLDIGMSGTNGYELASRLRADSQLPELYLVAITGWGREEDRRAMAAGFDDHLTKPALRRRLPRSSPGGFVRPSTPSSARKSAAAKHQEAQGLLATTQPRRSPVGPPRRGVG